jgi:ADP-heptose:LPS heptosyltransferase
VFSRLQIYDPRERWLVGTADTLLRVPAALARLRPRRPPMQPPRRILLLRLERIGDLLMSAPAIAAVRTLAPHATIDLVVGSWNKSLAALIPGIDTIETLDAPWLARTAQTTAPAFLPAGASATPQRGGEGVFALAKRAVRWRPRHYDLAINFEGDIRSHILMSLSGAPARVGFDMAGGGPLLTTRVEFRPNEHTTANAERLVGAAFDAQDLETARPPFTLALSAEARARAAALLAAKHTSGRPLIAIHASGGRAIKQWPPARFADVAVSLARDQNAQLLLTGTAADRPLVNEMRAALPTNVGVLDLVGELDQHLPLLAAILERCRLLITGDTGPMHLAAFVGTPIVAIFGPSDPIRYAPFASPHRVVRIDLPCAPCNRIRLPPTRCQGHTPDCLEGVTRDAVYKAACDLIAETARGLP